MTFIQTNMCFFLAPQFKIAALSVELQLFGYLVVTASWEDAGTAMPCQAI